MIRMLTILTVIVVTFGVIETTSAGPPAPTPPAGNQPSTPPAGNQEGESDPSRVKGFDRETVGKFDNDTVAGFDRDQMGNFDPTAMAGFSKDHLQNFDAEAVNGLQRKQIREINDKALTGFKEEHVRNFSDDSRNGLGDKVSTFKDFDIGVRKVLIDQDSRRLGGVGSFKDLVRSVNGEITKEQLDDLGWDESKEADSVRFGSQETSIQAKFEEAAENQAKSAFSQLKLVSD